jgi:hypothetical protein
MIGALPLQVYVRRGELVIHFSTPADLVNRVVETSVVLSDVDRHTGISRPGGKADRAARRGGSRTASTGGALKAMPMVPAATTTSL